MINRTQIPEWAKPAADPSDRDLSGDELRLAYNVVSLSPTLDEETRRGLFEQVVKGMQATRYGSTFVPVDNPDWLRLAPSIVGSPGDATPFIIDSDRFYHHRNFSYEVELARAISSKTVESDFDSMRVSQKIAQIVQAPSILDSGDPILLSDEQQEALRIAAGNRFSIISGGPGTGKTSIVVSLLRLFAKLGVSVDDVLLAAPTGKAASKMTASIREQLERIEALDEDEEQMRDALPGAQTVHRVLGYSTRTRSFSKNAEHPLACRVVIVDEASMIDLSLMAKLLRAIPEKAALILVGDAQQLPSVDAGAVLRDLVPEDNQNNRHVAFLKRSFRMRPDDPSGQKILSAASSINVGDSESFRAGVKADAISLGGVAVIESVGVDAPLRTLVDGWFDARYAAPHVLSLARRTYALRNGEFDDDDRSRIADLLAHYQQGRVLCVTRVWSTGSESLNDMFHRRMIDTTKLEGEPRFVAGEPLLMLRNDYERELFNGDQGVVLFVSADDGPAIPMAIFPSANRFRAHHLSSLGNRVSLAYAMTVHKSQGSEFDDVVVVLPSTDIPLLTRELFYTAVTRAKRSVTVVGSWSLIDATIHRKTERHSGLRERIASAD